MLTAGRLTAGCVASLGLVWLLGAASQAGETTLIAIDHPAIQYDTRPVDDRVTRLSRDLGSGKITLKPTADGYLSGLLNALEVNPDWQALVFSKTSFQAARIDPRNPRALYFSDDVMVGFVRGSEYQRLYEVLTGRDQNDKFKRISAEDRQAVLEILRETKPRLPAYFKTGA